MTDTKIFHPGAVTLQELAEFDGHDGPPRIDRSCRASVERAAGCLSQAARGDEPVYGVNTGFGKLASTRIPSDRVEHLQHNLIQSHCCGIGRPLSPRVVRMMMTLKVISLGRGASGVRWTVIKCLEAMLDKGVLPIIPEKGSVGASGDLAPLAHMAAVMIGYGEATYDGQRLSGLEAMNSAGVETITLGPKEGLALINGTQCSTALALIGLIDAWTLALTSLVTGALSTDAAMGSGAPFRSEIHALRGHGGQIAAASILRDLMGGSEIREAHRSEDERVQDPYCLRCQPQVVGAALDLLKQAGQTIEIEANAVTDNPLVLSDGSIVSGGNFHAEPIAFAADQIALAIAELGSIAERRIATLVDPALNYGLPPFLSAEPGLNSGFMIAEVTAAALMAENKHMAMPCSIDSTPTSANQEDHVSMACHAARRLGPMNSNLATILGVELLTGAQGAEFRAPLKTSQALSQVIGCLRAEVESLHEDRFMAPDLERATALVMSGKPIAATELDCFPGPGLLQ